LRILTEEMCVELSKCRIKQIHCAFDNYKDKAIVVEKIKLLSESLSQEIFSNWENQITLRKTIEKEIRKFLIKNKQVFDLSLEQIDLLSNKILESLQKYEKRG